MKLILFFCLDIVEKIFSLVIFTIILYISIGIKLKYEIILDYPKFILDEYKNIFDTLNKRNNFDLFRKKNKIENIFILIIIFPFLKKEILITKKNPIYELLSRMIHSKNNEIIKINKNLKNFFFHRFKDLLYYKWEILPNKNQTNYLRHILYHYYNEDCLNIYEKSLNLNIKYFFDNYDKKSYEIITDLMSKIYLNIIYIRKFRIF